ARIQSVLRRFSPKEEKAGIFKSGILVVDMAKRIASLKSKDMDLTTTEFEILAFFMANPSIVMNRDKIMEYLKGIECDAFNRSIDVAVSRLRKKIGESAEKP